jgi:two-component system chemotaxis response regulator CheY
VVATVLFVDDDVAMRELATTSLQARGFHVAVACDACEAMTLLGEVAPDVVVTDLQMPGMDGIGFCRYVRDHPVCSTVPIVVLSGLPADDMRALRVRSIAGAEYLVKSEFRLLGERIEALTAAVGLQGGRASMWADRMGQPQRATD